MDRPPTKDIARFFDKVQITKHCWLWTGYLDRDGYGRIWFGRKRYIKAHRFSYQLFVGSIELGKHILHRRECGNRNCVNPHHLYMGTNADNMRDRKLWGKGYYVKINGNAKLSESDVLSIRKIHENKRYGYKATAKIFDIGTSEIGFIVRGQRWKHLIT